MLISYLASRMLNHPTRSDYVQGSKDAMVERPSARRVGRGCTGRPAHSHSVISTIVNLRHYLFRSFCQGCCLWDSIRFRIVIVPITGTIPVFSLSYRVIHPRHTLFPMARPRRTTRHGAEEKASSHRNSHSDCHTLFSSAPYYQS